MVDVHRMVARLGELMQDAHAASALGSGGEDGIAEILLVHHLRAGEGEEDAARLDFLERLGIELAIATEGIAERVTVLGKGRNKSTFPVRSQPTKMESQLYPYKVNFLRKGVNHSRKTSQLLQKAKSTDSVRKWNC